MERHISVPRDSWQKTVESQGLLYHTLDGVPYWDESVYYSFSMEEITQLENTTNELHQMCLVAAQHVIDERRFSELGIPEFIIPTIIKSWNDEPPALYGRFDLRYDGTNPPKMLEYNADTPTSLLEAAVIQWQWMEEVFDHVHGDIDQWNSIHDKLIAKFTELKEYLHPGRVHFTSMDTVEDFMTISYLQEVAQQSGLQTSNLKIEDIGWDSKDKCFIDLEYHRIKNLFKLYPWEWLIHENFGSHISETLDQMFWMEPTWKLLLSNKGILPILWELYPGHPNLLPAYFQRPEAMTQYAKKPLLSREGANVTLVTGNNTFQSSGDYGEEGFIYQEYCPLPAFGGENFPVLGSWVIDQEAAGMGIRESKQLITDNTSRFVPHIITI